jgi:hypothetical protein
VGLITTGKVRDGTPTASGRTGRPVGRPPLHANKSAGLQGNSDDDVASVKVINCLHDLKEKFHAVCLLCFVMLIIVCIDKASCLMILFGVRARKFSIVQEIQGRY